ncbi:NUDIX hydrolase [Rothia mucilaginosa]|uniref:NUDIX hydrolase n=1 Tax=Rothia mucilaginosa TaxID=43675 RepID=UPI0009BAB1A3|nr:NUDIX domain-containing protein [Rothia mucilaginosa]
MPTQKNPQNRVEATHTTQTAEPAERNVTEHSAIDSAHRVVNVCAVAIRNRDGLVLTVRKQGSDGFMMPGGKPEPGETPLQTACREVSEEIGLTPDPVRMHYLGTLEAAALNESGFTVRAETYEYAPTDEQHELLATLVPHAEIAELRWVNPAMSNPSDSASQAPLNTEQIFPLLARTPLP